MLPYSIPPYHAYSTIAFAVILRQFKLETNPQIHHNYQLRFRSAFLVPFFVFSFFSSSLTRLIRDELIVVIHVDVRFLYSKGHSLALPVRPFSHTRNKGSASNLPTPSILVFPMSVYSFSRRGSQWRSVRVYGSSIGWRKCRSAIRGK